MGTANVDDIASVYDGVKPALRNTSATPGMSVNVSEFARSLDRSQLPAPPSPEKVQKVFTAAAKYHYWIAAPEENAAIGMALT
jgi:hypothetical protein